MVRTHEIGKHFPDSRGGTVRAVDGVTIVAEPGRIFGLLGVNGAGKTTLLRMLSTVIAPTHGTAEIAGYDVREHPQRVRASIGFMSTSTALYGRLTAREVIEYFGGLYGLRGATLRRRMDEVCDKLAIGPFADRLCDKLSTGQKQRVSIARTILHEPPVLFFDEPTSGLDVVTSQTVMEFIEEVRDAGKTIVYCTHIMSEVERLCDHVAVIHDGRIMGEGTVEELKGEAQEPTLEKAFLKLVQFQSELGREVDPTAV
jgi:sodium transport system ATP-binding protein